MSNRLHRGSRAFIEKLFARADVRVDGGRAWDLTVRDEGVFDRVLAHGTLGLGESYMDGWWDCPRLDEMVARLVRHDVGIRDHVGWREGLLAVKAKLVNPQSARRAGKGVRHYEFGNDFFEGMLGPTMNYSCAYWRDAASLDEAQEHKLDLTCRKLGLNSTDTVLDIGCGWGSFARYAASKYGCRVVGITLAREQARHARELCKGLPVEIRLTDYRDPTLRGPFSKIVSIGMFEHVGRDNYRTFAEVSRRLMSDDGLMVLHTIGNARSDFARDAWLDRYVFPGHLVPNMLDIAKALHGLLVMEDWHNFGADYDRTLMAWHENFERMIGEGHGPPDERTRRLFRFYLLGCAGHFRARRTSQLWQIVVSKEGVPGGYQSVR